MRVRAALAILLLLAVYLAACDVTDDNKYWTPSYTPPEHEQEPRYPGDDDTADDPSDDAWPDNPLPQWLRARPQLQDRSLWQQEIDMANPAWPRNLGCMGVGNGKVFGILGDQYPLGTWHNLGGPNYEMDLKWFSDKEPWLIVRGHYLEPDTQSISRVRQTPIVITTADNGSLEWTSVNFAPLGAANELAEHALVSVWIVRNRTDHAVDEIFLEIDANLGNFGGQALREANLDGRYLAVRPLGVQPVHGDAFNDMWIPVGELAPGEERVIVVPYVFTIDDEDPTPVFDAIREEGVDALLAATIESWDAWFAQMTEFDTPDQKFNDLMNGLALAIKVSQTAAGGLSEMSQYSHVWTRDTHGPALFFPLVGLADDVQDMVDYHWGATLVNGDLSNAYPADLDLSELPPQPDWDSLGEMSGFARAEAPSILVLQYENLYKATGDLEVIQERYGLLKHALVDQQFVDGCLLYFSGDETFEDIMEVAFNEIPIPDPDESVLSLYSSLLMMRAARFMADMATLLGKPADAALFADLADGVETCMDDTFWIEDRGFYGPKADTASREAYPKPYEDVNTMPLWLDAMPRDNENVVRNFESVLKKLGKRDGTAYSPMGSIYRAVFKHIKKGIQTGMSHGYWLNNLDKMFHPTADKAFDRWRDVPSSAGFTDEGVVVDDYGHLQLLREPWGIVGNVSARFRSWESGIMAHAFLFHLTGFDHNIPEQTVQLAPHLPARWDHFAMRGLALGAGRFDLEVLREGGQGRRLVLTTDDQTAFTLSLVVPLDAEVGAVTVNGETLPKAQYTAAANAYGRVVVEFAPLTVPADAVTEIVIEAAE